MKYFLPPLLLLLTSCNSYAEKKPPARPVTMKVVKVNGADAVTLKQLNYIVRTSKRILYNKFNIDLKYQVDEVLIENSELTFPNEMIPFLERFTDVRKVFASYDLFYIVTPPLSWGADKGGPQTPYKYLAGGTLPEIYFKDDVKIINHCLIGRGGSISTAMQSAIRALKRKNYLRASALIFLHEILHQLGAWHDPKDAKTIMSESLNSQIEASELRKIPIRISAKTVKDVNDCLNSALSH